MGNPTERVRKLLKERGVTYDEKSVDGCGTLFSINLLEQCDDYTSSIFVYNTYIEVTRKYLTPEQAIAATLCEYTYEQWRAINEIVGNAMEYAHDVAIRHPDKADPYWDLSNYVDQILEVAFGKHEHEKRSCAACPEMDNPDSYIFHLMRALEHERGCCRDCKHSHMTSDGKHCKWCSVLATHDIEGEGCCDPSNGYDPEPYFDAGFHCGFFERRVSE